MWAGLPLWLFFLDLWRRETFRRAEEEEHNRRWEEEDPRSKPTVSDGSAERRRSRLEHPVSHKHHLWAAHATFLISETWLSGLISQSLFASVLLWTEAAVKKKKRNTHRNETDAFTSSRLWWPRQTAQSSRSKMAEGNWKSRSIWFVCPAKCHFTQKNSPGCSHQQPFDSTPIVGRQPFERNQSKKSSTKWIVSTIPDEGTSNTK